MQATVLPEQFAQRLQVAMPDKERAAFSVKLRDDLRAEIKSDIERFIASGGKITDVGSSAHLNAGAAQSNIRKYHGQGVSNIPGAKVEFSHTAQRWKATLGKSYLGSCLTEAYAEQLCIDAYKRIKEAAAERKEKKKITKTIEN